MKTIDKCNACDNWMLQNLKDDLNREREKNVYLEIEIKNLREQLLREKYRSRDKPVGFKYKAQLDECKFELDRLKFNRDEELSYLKSMIRNKENLVIEIQERNRTKIKEEKSKMLNDFEKQLKNSNFVRPKPEQQVKVITKEDPELKYQNCRLRNQIDSLQLEIEALKQEIKNYQKKVIRLENRVNDKDVRLEERN